MMKEIIPSAVLDPEGHSGKYDQRTTQQLFIESDAMYLYYIEKKSVKTSMFGKYTTQYVPHFYWIPFGGYFQTNFSQITFWSEIRELVLPGTSAPHKIDANEANVLAREATLTYLDFSQPCKSVPVFRYYDEVREKEILEVFRHVPKKRAEPSSLASWHILLDRYLAEKRGDTDIADTAIQTFWFADYLARRRRARLGVKADELYEAKEILKSPFVVSSNDGRCTRTTVFTSGEKTTVYTLGEEKLTISPKRPVNFSVLATDNPQKTRVCPNCSSESKREDCANGCPYCGTKFNLTDYNYQVAGESYGNKNYQPGLIRLILSVLIGFLFALQLYLTGKVQNLNYLFTVGVLVGTAFGFIAYVLLLLPIDFYLYIRRVRDSRFAIFCRELCQNDPFLSTDELSAEFQSRIRAFFLSDESDNIHFISGIKPGQYADVADVRIDWYKSLNVVPSTEYSIIRARVKLDLIRVKDGKLKREKAPFTIDFRRSSAVKTDLRPEKEIFTCPSCTGSLSILDGGHCNFCGTTTDMTAYGWVLSAVNPE